MLQPKCECAWEVGLIDQSRNPRSKAKVLVRDSSVVDKTKGLSHTKGRDVTTNLRVIAFQSYKTPHLHGRQHSDIGQYRQSMLFQFPLR